MWGPQCPKAHWSAVAWADKWTSSSQPRGGYEGGNLPPNKREVRPGSPTCRSHTSSPTAQMNVWQELGLKEMKIPGWFSFAVCTCWKWLWNPCITTLPRSLVMVTGWDLSLPPPTEGEWGWAHFPGQCLGKILTQWAVGSSLTPSFSWLVWELPSFDTESPIF